MDNQNVRVLAQYLNALSEAGEQLEKAYINRNMANFLKVKKFMLDIKSKIDVLLK